MTQFEYYQFPYNADNYGVLIHDPSSGETACVDAGDFAAYDEALTTKGWTLTQIWVTHHHADHTAGLLALKNATGARAYGPKLSKSSIGGLDVHLGDADNFTFAGSNVAVLETPGHTLDMINFYLGDDGVVFSGDTLFALGCGRLFEGTAEQMWQSLCKLMALPDETVVYCSHEYTEANAQFALSVDPDNAALLARTKEIEALRAAGKPTVPTTIGLERTTNPFVRAGDPAIRAHLNMSEADDASVFAEVRARKDSF